MLLDLEKVQEHESKQQKLVEGIIDSLHNATRDDQDYRKMFLDIGMCILLELRGKPVIGQEGAAEFKNYVAEPISVFAKTKAEQNLLLFKVFEKTVAPISSQVHHAYNSEAMGLVKK